MSLLYSASAVELEKPTLDAKVGLYVDDSDDLALPVILVNGRKIVVPLSENSFSTLVSLTWGYLGPGEFMGMIRADHRF